ncbi:hypothetical protein [Campylobacter concisus]|uniref:hypothetical protein n=1 Tax=Campylobacter concisus TaxID=199 RepID=UPI000CD9A65D|nr:hypothetical protein [Campylobacter concisus]
MAACNDKFQDQARWLSGVVLEFVMFELNLTFCSEKFWQNFEINFASLVRNAKATNVVRSNFNQN